jgi:biotin carboxyl carrier protein
MIFEVAVGSRVRTISIQRKGNLLQVAADGQTYLLDARRVNGSVISLLLPLAEGRAPVRSVDATFAAQRTPGDFDVHVDGRSVAVQVRLAGAFSRLRRGGATAHGTGPQRVTSPMPGKIVRLLVAAGDEVKAKQGLVVVEAMKMENELRAARDGRVREVFVAEGQPVDAGTMLLVVE